LAVLAQLNKAEPVGHVTPPHFRLPPTDQWRLRTISPRAVRSTGGIADRGRVCGSTFTGSAHALHGCYSQYPHRESARHKPSITAGFCLNRESSLRCFVGVLISRQALLPLPRTPVREDLVRNSMAWRTSQLERRWLPLELLGKAATNNRSRHRPGQPNYCFAVQPSRPPLRKSPVEGFGRCENNRAASNCPSTRHAVMQAVQAVAPAAQFAVTGKQCWPQTAPTANRIGEYPLPCSTSRWAEPGADQKQTRPGLFHRQAGRTEQALQNSGSASSTVCSSAKHKPHNPWTAGTGGLAGRAV